MKYEVYKEIRVNEDLSIFDFISLGKNGPILKRIQFIPTGTPGFISLAFGDMNENNQIDDYSISNNGDRNKLLATIAYAIDIYLTKYPDRWIYIKGSTGVERDCIEWL